MTVVEIQKRIRQRGKKLSRPGLYFHIKSLKLKPRGVARPAIYPDNTAALIIKRLGLPPKNGNGHHAPKRGGRR